MSGIFMHKLSLPAGRNKWPAFSSAGKIGTGVTTVLGMITAFSLALVFGLQQLSPYDSHTVTGYTCCDSGEGEACRPLPGITVFFRGLEYGLLKKKVYLKEGEMHLVPAIDEEVVGLQPNQHVYLNDTNNELHEEYNVPLWEAHHCPVHGYDTDNLDTIWSAGLMPNCEAIPDDEIIYLCTEGCDDNGNAKLSGTGIFDVYFRTADYPDPGIPNAVKNCFIPEVTPGNQTVINLPSPTNKKDLQMETFFVENDPYVVSWVSPYCKPAIYVYPTEKTFISVKLNPKLHLLYTDPAYPPSGWTVWAYPDGTITDKNSRYEYLYYEAEIPSESLNLPEEGYVVSGSAISGFLPELVKKLGLNEKESNDFSDYWRSALPAAPFYQIKVISRHVLDTISPLDITPQPKNLIRVTLHFTALDEEISLPAPKIAPASREGYTVVEWGGVFRYDPKRPFSCLM